MRVESHHPALAALKLEVEAQWGRPSRSPKEFAELSSVIEGATGRPISDLTLQRLWGYRPGYSSISGFTLDTLCLYLGFSCWEEFCLHIQVDGACESDLFEGSSLRISHLTPGQLIRIAWLPNRLCVLRYLGEYRFEAVETRNSKLNAGDTFTCMHIQCGKAMYVSHLVREEKDWEYIIGSHHGLTQVEVL